MRSGGSRQAMTNTSINSPLRADRDFAFWTISDSDAESDPSSCGSSSPTNADRGAMEDSAGIQRTEVKEADTKETHADTKEKEMAEAHINDMTVAELKAALSSRGLPANGKKQVLCQRLKASLHP